MTKPAERPLDASADTVTLADHLFATVSRSMTRIRRQMRRHGSIDLTVPQYRALRYVQRHPETSLTHLAESLGMSLSSVSALVERLVKVGHLEREVDPAVRRRIRLRLSPSGRRLLQQAEFGTRRWLAAELAGLTDAERRLLDGALDVLARIGVAEDDPA